MGSWGMLQGAADAENGTIVNDGSFPTSAMSEAQTTIRENLARMLAIVDSSPDALATRYSELRDGSYDLAMQVRTAAMPDPEPRTRAYIFETTGRKWTDETSSGQLALSRL